MKPPPNCTMRTFLVATEKRNKSLYPHPSDFTYDLPIALHNIVGISIRDYKYGNQNLINENNRYMSININGTSSTITMVIGNYSRQHSTLTGSLTTAFTAGRNTTFSVDTATGRTKIAYTGTGYILIKAHPILKILGFENGDTVGVCIYASTPPVLPDPDPVVMAQSSIIATNQADMYNTSDMVLRITNVETILSNDPVTDRSTAVLFNTLSDTTTSVVSQSLDHYIPLLQQQSRLQSLKIKLLDIDGNRYEPSTVDPLFLIQFYCLPRDS